MTARMFTAWIITCCLAASACSGSDESSDDAYVGETLAPFTLPECSTNAGYSFFGPELADYRFSVVNIAAGWCEACSRESAELSDRITVPYGDRGVRVIQVYVEEEPARPADIYECAGWTGSHGLVNVQLYDPDQAMKPYWSEGTLPATLIVDREGTIRFYKVGEASSVDAIGSALDRLLIE